MTERKDSWTQEDDSILAELVLHHIRTGSTQIKAFEEAGERLERTSGACGFRWNSEVRKHYLDALRVAKEERKTNKEVQLNLYPSDEAEKELVHVSSSDTLTLTVEDQNDNDVTEEAIKEEAPHNLLASPEPSTDLLESFDAAESLDMIKNYIAHLEAEIRRLTDENERLKETSPKEDLSHLLSILDRARETIANKVG